MPGLTPKRRDDLVMGTNSSSIVSKRSVERLYFTGDPQHVRFFVNKFQRRAPLINRGYHLRMHLVDVVVRRFLSRPAARPKVVVNLGCGSDPLPWRTMARHPEHCRGAIFVDIDFPDLLALKRDVVERTPALRAPLANLRFPRDDPRLLVQSDQYCQVACDLSQLAAVREALAQAVDVASCELLFVAEVSITYMEAAAADALIAWAATLGHVEFCLLEQLLPDGPHSPFACTMLQHFNKLNTPIKCVQRYPTAAAQQQRFRHLGWSDARAWSLWDAWSDPLFLLPDERRALDNIEVFDEWEEFAHFASHYFLLYARNGVLVPAVPTAEVKVPDAVSIPTTQMALSYTPTQGLSAKSSPTRRFSGALRVKDVLGQQAVANMFGFGADGRLRSCDLYSNSHSTNNQALQLPADLHRGGPAARSCFSLTDLGDAGYLLSGGRASPAAPFADCWLFKKDTNQWLKTHNLPTPLFRHAVARLGDSQMALLAGGRAGPATTHLNFLVYHPSAGWLMCTLRGDHRPPAVSGSLIICLGPARGSLTTFRGVLAGGMTEDGLVSPAATEWTLDLADLAEPSIHFQPTARSWATHLLARFGAVSTQVGGWTVVVGGVTAASSVLHDCEIVRFRAFGEADEAVECLAYVDQLGPDTPRPVLVGASIIDTGNGEVAILGGGMTSFSMGTVWSKGVYAFNAVHPASETTAWRYVKTLAVTNEEKPMAGGPETVPVGLTPASPIPRMKLGSAQLFQQVLQRGQPVIFEDLDLGPCLQAWDLSYLVESVGRDRKVVVHDSAAKAMDFLAKNFRYVTQTFQEFVHDVDTGKQVYLRALSADKPSDAPARLEIDFPTIAADFLLPPPLALAQERLFSSVLRVSGPVNMWLHYDVLANVYCQIRGSKRFYLFPPADVTRLGFAPGASSSSIDVFSALVSSSLRHCHPHEAIIGPGDVLFLPPLWLHTATPTTPSSVAVNVFFKDLAHGYSAGRDVYGNRDLAAYEKARQDVAKMANAFKDLPRDTRQFYLARIADELLQAASE